MNKSKTLNDILEELSKTEGNQACFDCSNNYLSILK